MEARRAPVLRTADWARDAPEIARLCWGYRRALAEATADRPEIVADYYGEAEFAALIDRLPTLHAPPGGAVLVAEGATGLSGVAMLVDRGDGLCEIKRVFVDPEAAGQGLGRALVVAMMSLARSSGHRRMVLDTMAPLVPAIRLYERLGFAPCPPFYELPPDRADCILFFGTDL
jgi:putative acetyltransferase